MRVRAYVHALARHELHRPEMIEEDEGADHLALAVRQRAAHLESIAEVAGARHDDQFQRVAGFGIAEHGIVGGKPAHKVSIIFANIIAAFIWCRPSAETGQSRLAPANAGTHNHRRVLLQKPFAIRANDRIRSMGPGVRRDDSWEDGIRCYPRSSPASRLHSRTAPSSRPGA